MMTEKGQVVRRPEEVERADGAGQRARRHTGIPGLVPGTGLTLDELQQLQIRARREQARAVRAALGAAVGWLGTLLGGLTASIRRRQAIRKAVRELSALDDRLLRDIGISRSDIHAVAAGTADPRLGAPWVRYARGTRPTRPAEAVREDEPPRKAA